MNDEKAIAKTLKEAFAAREASYNETEILYDKQLKDCIVEASKANDLSPSFWYILCLSSQWMNNLLDWCDEILKDGTGYSQDAPTKLITDATKELSSSNVAEE